MQKIMIKIASMLWFSIISIITADFAILAIFLDGVPRAICSILMLFGVFFALYWINTPYNPDKGGKHERRNIKRQNSNRKNCGRSIY